MPAAALVLPRRRASRARTCRSRCARRRGTPRARRARSASTAGAIETSAGKQLARDGSQPRLAQPAHDDRRAEHRAERTAGSPSAASPPAASPSPAAAAASASASRAGPRRSGFWIRDARRRFRAEATSIRPSSRRIAHAHACGPCTSTPFGERHPAEPDLLASAIAAKGSRRRLARASRAPRGAASGRRARDRRPGCARRRSGRASRRPPAAARRSRGRSRTRPCRTPRAASGCR